MTATEVIGRDDELRTILGFLDRVSDGPCALVLSGEAGIGKTSLWEAGVEEAQQRFGRVLLSRGVEAEASLSFAGLSSLLGGLLDEVGPSLVPPRRRALEVALLLVEPGDQPPDAHAIGLAMLDVLRALAQSEPILVALDDVQWLDPASAGAIQIALRRLREEPVGMLATLRTAPELEDPFELERSVLEGRLQRVTVGPLSVGALHQLLTGRLGLELTRPELGRVQEATGGNPFFALELGRELVRTNTRPTTGQALHIPESLRELLGGRLARLPADTVEVLLLVAALARPTVDLVGRAHGDRERVLAALETAVGEAVVVLQEASIRFAHPLLGSICYEQAPVWIRRAVHRTLAGVVSDVEERARHLALAAEGPDSAAASYLETAAQQAGFRGAPAAAAELLELAAELTPGDPVLARERRFRSARFHRLAGGTERAHGILEQLLTVVPAGVERADILFELARVFTDASTSVRLCEEALAETTGDDARSAQILGFRSVARLNEGNLRAALLDARAALEKAERIGDPVLLAVTIGAVGRAETWTAEFTPGLLERGVEIEERLGLELEFTESPRVVLARLLTRRGELDRAHVLLEELEARAAARGDEISRMLMIWYLSIVQWFAGRWQQALHHATAAQELAEHTGWVPGRMWAGRVTALVETDLGLTDEARARAEAAFRLAGAGSWDVWSIVSLGNLGRVELSLGNIQAAGEHLRDLPARLHAGGITDPTLTIWADAIETLIALGELAPAGEYLERYERNSIRFGSPWARAAAARCRGLLAVAEGDLAAALESFESSLADAAAFPLERGRTLLCLGVVRRQARQKRAAREALEEAVAVFEDLGARLWAERARAELKRISGRAPASNELTESERRVAVLAAQGRTNREIAAELFMGVSTVEAHLSRVYRKLGVRRAGLAARLATSRVDTSKPMGEGVQL